MLGRSGTAELNEVHLHTRVASPIARKETGKQGLHRLRQGAQLQHARLSTLERPRPLAEGFDVRQQSPRPLQQVLALGGKLGAAPDPVEQLDIQRGLKGTDLPRQRWLAYVQPADGPAEAAGIDDGHEGAQMSQVHP